MFGIYSSCFTAPHQTTGWSSCKVSKILLLFNPRMPEINRAASDAFTLHLATPEGVFIRLLGCKDRFTHTLHKPSTVLYTRFAPILKSGERVLGFRTVLPAAHNPKRWTLQRFQ